MRVVSKSYLKNFHSEIPQTSQKDSAYLNEKVSVSLQKSARANVI